MTSLACFFFLFFFNRGLPVCDYVEQNTSFCSLNSSSRLRRVMIQWNYHLPSSDESGLHSRVKTNRHSRVSTENPRVKQALHAKTSLPRTQEGIKYKWEKNENETVWLYIDWKGHSNTQWPRSKRSHLQFRKPQTRENKIGSRKIQDSKVGQ